MEPYILIVDDDYRLTNALRRTLTYEGYHVLTTANAEEALTQVHQRIPDLVNLTASYQKWMALKPARAYAHSAKIWLS